MAEYYCVTSTRMCLPPRSRNFYVEFCGETDEIVYSVRVEPDGTTSARINNKPVTVLPLIPITTRLLEIVRRHQEKALYLLSVHPSKAKRYHAAWWALTNAVNAENNQEEDK